MLGTTATYFRRRSPRHIAFESASSRGRTSNARPSPASTSIEAGTHDQSTARLRRKAKPSAARAGSRSTPGHSRLHAIRIAKLACGFAHGQGSAASASDEIAFVYRPVGGRERHSATEDASVDAGVGRLQCRGLRLASVPVWPPGEQRSPSDVL